MNKVSRKSGGVALNKVSPEFEKYLGYVNEVALFIEDQNIVNPTYFELPAQPSQCEPQPIIDIFSGPMKHLETVLRIISPDFAKDVLNASPYFAGKSDDQLTELLNNPEMPIFNPRLGDEGTRIFLACLERYEGFDHLYYVLDELIFTWRHKKDEAELFFGDVENADKALHLKNRHFNWNDSFSISVNRKLDSRKKPRFHLQLACDDWVKILQNLEIERVRRCSHCRKFYWAERTDTPGCYECSSNGGKPIKDFPEMRRKGLCEIEAEQKRNLEIRRKVESQPAFVYEPPQYEEVIKEHDESFIGKIVLKNGELYTVTEVRHNLLCLTPIPKLGIVKKAYTKVIHAIWGN